MNQLRYVLPVTDVTSMGLSMLCVVHCFLTPVLLVMTPAFLSMYLGSELFHLWLVLAVIPMSIFALTLGCRRHKRYKLLMLGLVGIVFLTSALLLEGVLGEIGEKSFTLVGSVLIAWGHFINFKLCRQQTPLRCC